MDIYFVTNDKPLSHNAKGREDYKKQLGQEFTSISYLYSNLPIIDETLESKVLYFNRLTNAGNVPDIDNLSKPLIDAFTGIIYKDDKQIIKRSAIRLDLEPLEIVPIDCSCLPYEIYIKFDKYMMSHETHLLLLNITECDKECLKEEEV